jgi:hypothetical protein
MSIENDQIPMSTLISDLNNINEIKEEDFRDEPLLSEDELDKIIDNQIVLDNNFVNYLNNNCNLNNIDDVPSVHIIMQYYLNKMKNEVFPDCNNRYLITFIRFIHIIGIIFMMVGCTLPKTLLPYHIIFCLKSLILWDIFDEKCYMSLIIQKIAAFDNYHEFIPANIYICKICVLTVMFISIFGIAFPEISLFNLLSKLIDYLKIYK